MRRFISSHQSVLIATTIAVMLTLWLLSGSGANGAAPAPAPTVTRATQAPFAVRVATSTASPVSRDVVIYGRTEPARAVTLRAELEGRVVELGAHRGAPVEKGALIARLGLRDLAAQLTEARAQVRQRELEYDAAKRLQSKQFQTQTALAAAAANLAAARTRVRSVQVSMDNTTIQAPFGGILEARPVEVGDFVSEGDDVARLIEVDPLVVAGTVTQRELTHIHTGAEGIAVLLTGERIPGRVRYISSESDAATRTFRVELEVANPDRRWVAGVTAEIRVPTPSTRAHLLSPALLSMDERQRVGVKIVTDDSTVAFLPVGILRSDKGGIWVTGLPEQVRVITVGQGFVREGDRVDPVPDGDGDATTLSALERRRG